MLGGDKDDVLIGNDGDDILIGNYGSDVLEGGNGDDIIVGTRNQINSDKEVDTLTGGAGADQFWLGTDRFAYKNKKTTPSNFNNSYALITDFNPGEGDVIHWYDCVYLEDNYEIKPSPENLPTGAAIVINEQPIAIIQNQEPNDLDLSKIYFNFHPDTKTGCPPQLT